MKAIAYAQTLAIENPQALEEVTLPDPAPERPHDLLVRVEAVSVNPVDTKVRHNRQPRPGQFEVLGWDAVGTVLGKNAEAHGFEVGDRVFYAGAIDRPGCDSELHVVDARLVGHAPKTLSSEQAAALPLTSLTAWELLFECLGVEPGGGEGKSLLIVGAAGGVGSMLVQLARQLTRLKVIATASRLESRRWVSELGAHVVIDHREPFGPQLQALGIPSVELVASLTHTAEHLDDIVAALVPRGKLALIDDFPSLDIMKLKSKSLSLHWEFMYTRSLHGTPDIARQGVILDEITRLVDSGRLRTTHAETLGRLDAANLRCAHALIEGGRTIGKLVLSGF